MSFDPAVLLLVIPAAAAALIAALPGTRATAYVNAGASFLTLLAALYLASTGEERSGSYLLIDSMNTVFLVLVAFVGFTTSVFSANYVAYELRSGRVTAAFMRLYHALYQGLALAFNVALLSNNPSVLAQNPPCTRSWQNFGHYVAVSDAMIQLRAAIGAQRRVTINSLYFEHTVLNPTADEPSLRYKLYTVTSAPTAPKRIVNASDGARPVRSSDPTPGEAEAPDSAIDSVGARPVRSIDPTDGPSNATPI